MRSSSTCCDLHQASILALARTDCHMGQEVDCHPCEFHRKPAKGFFVICTRIRYFLKASAAVSLASGFILGFQVCFWSRMLRGYRIGELCFTICRSPFGATRRADSKVRQRCSWHWRDLKARAVIRFDWKKCASICCELLILHGQGSVLGSVRM